MSDIHGQPDGYWKQRCEAVEVRLDQLDQEIFTSKRLLAKILDKARNRLLSVTNKEYDAILNEIEKYLGGGK